MLEIFSAFVLLALGWLWFDSLRARESAVGAARLACRADGVQLLDDTVALASLGLSRSDKGALAVRRVYRFEFSDTGNNRLGGRITMIGSRVELLYLDPHVIETPDRLNTI